MKKEEEIRAEISKRIAQLETDLSGNLTNASQKVTILCVLLSAHISALTDISSSRMERYTRWLIGLTIAVIAFTVVLIFIGLIQIKEVFK